MKKIAAATRPEAVDQGQTLRDLLTCDVALDTLERRSRVRLPKRAKQVENRVVAPNDDSWQLYRAAGGRAYYVQKEPDWWHKRPWKKTEWVKLTPLEAIAWCADGDGDLNGTPQMRRDALRQIRERKTPRAASRSLLGEKVHLAFAFTGGGTEFLLGAFALHSDAKAAVARESKCGRAGYVVTKRIR